MNRNGNNIRNISALIPRRLTLLECLRPNDIPHAVPHEEHRSCDLFLRVARDIRADNRQAQAEPQALEEAEPQRNEPAPFIRVWESHKQTRADDANAVGENHAGAAGVESA